MTKFCYYCNNCEKYIEYVIKKQIPFDHAFGVDYLNSRYCPICQSENVEEVDFDESFYQTNK